jgi:hypothetical protein
MMTQTQIKANKMWVDVMKGQPVTFTSDEETRVISRHSATMSVLESHKEQLVALTIANKAIDMYVQMETMKLVMEELIEAIEDFDDE